MLLATCGAVFIGPSCIYLRFIFYVCMAMCGCLCGVINNYNNISGNVMLCVLFMTASCTDPELFLRRSMSLFP